MTAPSARSVQVLRSGALTTVQDGGRPGLAHLGVPRSGALDRDAHHLANRLVANDEAAAVLETTMDGVALSFRTDAVVAVTGALGPIHLEGSEAGWSVPVAVRAGQTVDVGPAARGVRSYVAVGGGWQVPLVLGSASTDLLSGLGPAPLAAGDVLAIGAAPGPAPALDMAPYSLPPDHLELDLHLGPRHDWFTPEGIGALTTATWTVSSDSNRIALRLQGPPVERRRSDELASEGLVGGAIEVLADGQLVVFLADHPTTGGYPVAAVVDARSVGGCAQARPGATVTFRIR
jgi:biotin-dependent carboxylase-like uncharacterized protein